MKSIKNIKELDAELIRLQAKKSVLENGMRENVASIKEGLKPLKIVGRILSGFLKKDAAHDDVIARSLGFGASRLSQKYLLSTMSGPMRKVLSFVIENVIVNLASSKTTPLAATIAGFFKKKFYSKSEELSPESRVTLP